MSNDDKSSCIRLAGITAGWLIAEAMRPASLAPSTTLVTALGICSIFCIFTIIKRRKG